MLVFKMCYYFFFVNLPFHYQHIFIDYCYRYKNQCDYKCQYKVQQIKLTQDKKTSVKKIEPRILLFVENEIYSINS